MGAKQSQFPPEASPGKAEDGQSSPVRERESFGSGRGRVGGRGWVRGRRSLPPGSRGVFSAPPALQSPAWRKAAFALHPSVAVVVGAAVLQGAGCYRSHPPELDLKEDWIILGPLRKQVVM